MTQPKSATLNTKKDTAKAVSSKYNHANKPTSLAKGVALGF